MNEREREVLAIEDEETVVVEEVEEIQLVEHARIGRYLQCVWQKCHSPFIRHKTLLILCVMSLKKVKETLEAPGG